MRVMAMKSNFLGHVVFSVAFGVCSLAATPWGSLFAAPRNGQRAAQEQSSDQNQVRAFTGTVTKTGDRYALREDTSQIVFDLDDQTSACKFVGRKVKVTGTLDAVSNKIHVQTIEQASA
jgi:uncharacterized protein YdeI (BOF family)